MLKNIRKTKIVCTIGPASESVEMLEKLAKAGMNCARINFSHGNYEQNKEKIENIKKVREKLKLPIGIALDTKGPEIRTGIINGSESEKVGIKKGQEFIFTNNDVIGTNYQTSISYKSLYKEVKPGDKILVADGSLIFEVKGVNGKDIVTKALNTGTLGSRKNVNVPGVVLNQKGLSDKDIEDITNCVHANIDFIFASFVRRKEDVINIRNLVESLGGKGIDIISKIESKEGIDNFEEILEVSDGIMVARGDMGIEIPMEEVPVVQKRFIRRCNEEGKLVITATQMLETMIENPRPTRAEVSDVANAVYDLTGAIMLSGESAMGAYPVECVETMDKVAKTIEQDIHYWKRFDSKGFFVDSDNLKATSSYASIIMAENAHADAILAYTSTGETVGILSGLRPKCPIFAITDDLKTYYNLGLSANVTPVYISPKESIDETIIAGIRKFELMGILDKGDVIITVGGDKLLPMKKESHVIGGIIRI